MHGRCDGNGAHVGLARGLVDELADVHLENEQNGQQAHRVRLVRPELWDAKHRITCQIIIWGGQSVASSVLEAEGTHATMASEYLIKQWRGVSAVSFEFTPEE